MQCERLINLAKSWYLSVKDETMAPARMVQFIKNHVAGCEICLADPDIHQEIEKITEVILPESKIPKAVRLQQERDENEKAEYDEEETEETDDDEDETDDDENDEYMDDDEDLDEDLDELDEKDD
jgi:hypothetical protein